MDGLDAVEVVQVCRFPLAPSVVQEQRRRCIAVRTRLETMVRDNNVVVVRR